MNDSIPGVNAGYITRHKLLGDYLRYQQQAITSAIFASVDGLLSRDECLRIWLGRGEGRRKRNKGIVGQRVGRGKRLKAGHVDFP